MSWPKKNESVADLPHHLTPLLQPTPSGVAKLLAAWTGLHTETQIQILMSLDTTETPTYLKEKILINALDSTVPYVRYLAASRLYFTPHDTPEKEDLKRRIQKDPDPLVRYSLLERNYELKDADAFFALPHEARLAKVRLLGSYGQTIANLISHAVDHELQDGKISDLELYEILSDYLNKKEFTHYYSVENESYDGLSEYGRGKDIDALWHLVLKVPENISHILIAKLPPGCGLSTGIPDEVLKNMSERQLITLLNREDIELHELRKQIFFDTGNGHDELKLAAIRYHFDLHPAEFSKILQFPKEQAKDLLSYLHSARHLSVFLYQAVHDVALFTDVGDPLHAEYAINAFEERLEQLKGEERERQLRDLNLYRLARTAVPWKKDEQGYLPSGELSFLSKAVVEGDTWATFMGYVRVRKGNTLSSHTLEKYLASIDEDEE